MTWEIKHYHYCPVCFCLLQCSGTTDEECNALVRARVEAEEAHPLNTHSPEILRRVLKMSGFPTDTIEEILKKQEHPETRDLRPRDYVRTY